MKVFESQPRVSDDSFISLPLFMIWHLIELRIVEIEEKKMHDWEGKKFWQPRELRGNDVF